ncbi:phosphoenolpyruvate--protein phosphotransferase [Mycoplasma sp. Ms02]|uniref:phosphoenolpyruvate--protein phosphotransferase n=1 Tax=Mycoplasma sp. Ms02 TaxID=353851 RepID=UPI001C8A2745|nr:phosphoenolpyruvate--protein phosphotransferase [Mycoplasma sp. Ms02]QZE12302.1 phosphoenolpyruvate--protein phosphotransferase [Mycoplasma sp. Ms02]
MKIKGIGASRGVAISKVFKIEELPVDITKTTANPAADLALYEEAIETVVAKITRTKELAKDPEHAAIFDAHISFATDPYGVDTIKGMINDGKSAEFAVQTFYEDFAQMFAGMEDEYMRERAADVRDVAKKLLYVLNGIEEPDLTSIREEVVIVAEDLSPSQTVQLDKKYVKGFVTNIGGPTSHTAIMARSLGIASVVGAAGILDVVANGDTIALNGTNGEVVVNPSTSELKEYEAEKQKYEAYLAKLKEFKNKPSVTKDGHHIELAANIGTPADLPSVIDNDAEAIGLFRSEFLYMDNADWPNEEEQYEAYKKVIEGMEGKRVVIRTLDIGGDKTLKYYSFPHEMNPFLGYRAIRFCLDNLAIFKTQLRALIRAAKYGKLAIMIPMITNVEEFLSAKKVFEECYQELKAEGHELGAISDIEFGLMMETPAAAVLSDQFCKYADFVSIGTNDLIQYSMAADRMNEQISYLYQPLNPSILRLIKMVIDGAHKHGKWAGMCGEMAGSPEAMPLLIGLGLDEFSMSASNVLNAREIASKLNKSEMEELANKALNADSEQEVKELLSQYVK